MLNLQRYTDLHYIHEAIILSENTYGNEFNIGMSARKLNLFTASCTSSVVVIVG